MNTSTNQIYLGGTGGTVLVGGQVTGGVDMGAGSAVSANRIPTQSGVYNYVRNSTVTSFNGLTGAVGGVCAAQANTFTALQTFTAGISAAGGMTLDGGKVWHSLNDGITSGLDAGLVHGVCGSRFLENLQTGLLYGGLISVNAGNTAQVNITAGAGMVVSPGASLTAYPIPTVTPVTWAAKTGVTLAGLTSSDETWLAIDSSGNLVQTLVAFTDAQYSSQIPLGAALHSSRTNIQLIKGYPHVSYGQPEQFDPFIRAFGNLKLSGHEISANGANLNVNRSAGKAYAMGRNYSNDPNNPNIVTDTSAAPATGIYRFYRNGSGAFTTVINSAIDPSKYDNGTGTLATTTSAKFTIQRLFYLPDQPTLLGVYYGRQEYNSIADAQANIPFESFSESESTATQGIFCGWLIVQGNCTALNDTADAKFVNAGLFRNTANIGGGGLAIASIDDLNDVTTTTPSNNQVLRWNNGTAQWVNSDVSSLAVSSFNGLTGAVTGVTVGGANTFTALNTFNAGISAAGGVTLAGTLQGTTGSFSKLLTLSDGLSAAGGFTVGNDISVFGIRVGRGNRGASAGGDTNLAVGANALKSVIPNPGSYAGIQNLAFGTSALELTTSGGYNSAFGTEALYTNTSGNGNIAFGVHALRLNTSGAENCAFGGGPMYQNTTGGYNTAIGSLAYYYKSTGSYNVAVGFQAGYNFGTPRSGSNVTSATNCTLIGTYATPLTSGSTNEIVIGYDAIGKGSNTVSIGNSSITATHLTGLVNISSGLSAAGGATLGSRVDITGILDVVGGATMESTLDVVGVSRFAGGVTFAGTLQGTTGSFSKLLTLSNGLSAAGGVTFAGDIAVNGGDITTTSATATLYNTTATTVNIGNAASTVGVMGATAGARLNIGSNSYVKTGSKNTTTTTKQEIFSYIAVAPPLADTYFADIIITANYGGSIAGSISSQITKMLVATSYNTAINHTEYGNVNTAGNLAVYTAEISGNNVIIYATPTSSSPVYPTVFNTYATLIKGSLGANTEE
jgi:hypothetical protein